MGSLTKVKARGYEPPKHKNLPLQLITVGSTPYPIGFRRTVDPSGRLTTTIHSVDSHCSDLVLDGKHGGLSTVTPDQLREFAALCIRMADEAETSE